MGALQRGPYNKERISLLVSTHKRRRFMNDKKDQPPTHNKRKEMKKKRVILSLTPKASHQLVTLPTHTGSLSFESQGEL